MNTPNLENPSCLQATLASLVDHKPSQTVPHVSFQHSSTRPCLGTSVPTSLRSPLLQTTANTQKPNVPQCVRKAVSSHTATQTHTLVGTAHQHPQSGCSCVWMCMYSLSVGSQSQYTSHHPDGLDQPPG